MKSYKHKKIKKKSTKKQYIKKEKYISKSKKIKNKKSTKNKKFTKKGGVGESFVRHFRSIQDRIKKEKLRKQIESEILTTERFLDRQNKFNNAFLNDKCSICLEDLDDDKGKTQLQKCLNCIDKHDKRIYFTGCDHIFHGRCMDKWLSQDPTCPLCRERVIDNIEQLL
uniref:RING-type domain-containing protein n=1 Tax=viral metagenome TaxID=1070528 RepID=A0A6C0AY72_9ZZZZ|tara:strand:+ start:579 stop:1082 length:504 start_codon:yes stop_codon:yes gene_type:complete